MRILSFLTLEFLLNGHTRIKALPPDVGLATTPLVPGYVLSRDLSAEIAESQP